MSDVTNSEDFTDAFVNETKDGNPDVYKINVSDEEIDTENDYNVTITLADGSEQTVEGSGVRTSLNNLASFVYQNSARPFNSAAITDLDSPYSIPTVTLSNVTGTPQIAYNQVVLVDASGGAVTVNLPDASLCQGKTITVKRVEGGSNVITIASADDIDGSGSDLLASSYGVASYFSDGTTFHKIV